MLCGAFGQGWCSRVAFLFNELVVPRTLLKLKSEAVVAC